MNRASVGVVLIAVLTASCTAKPRLDLADIRSVQVQTSHVRAATQSEITQLVAAYRATEIMEDQLVGTTPDVQVSVLLASGETLWISGGAEPFQVISFAKRQVNVSGKELHELLYRLLRESP